MANITEHFKLEELTRTDTNLANEPNTEELANLTRLCKQALEPIRELIGVFHINSAFRSPEVNAAVGGANTSAHMRGLAADIVPLKVSRKVAFDLIVDSGIPFDQLIIEPTWLHIGLARAGETPRKQLLEAVRNGSGFTYRKVDPNA